MPAVTITYDNPETLKRLKEVAELWNFKISSEVDGMFINGVKIIPGDKTLDISELERIFTGIGIDSKKLREDAWKRSGQS